MRLTQHSGREGSPKHNDRTFDLSKADNIDTYRTFDNVSVNFCGNDGQDFKTAEFEFYKKNYGKALEISNQKKREQRHPEKVRTMKDIYNSKITQPEELILQIGDKNSNIDDEIFFQCANQYLKELNKWNNEHGNHMHILNASIHYDEATPHMHLRRVWDYKDENGITQINQNKALEAAGIERPNLDKPEGRRNNRKMSFDAMMREKWLDICESHGLQVEREPLKEKKRHMSVKEYKESKDAEKVKAFEKNIKDFVNGTLTDLIIMTDKKQPISKLAKAHSNFVRKANDFIKNNKEHYITGVPNEKEDNKLEDWKNMSEARRAEKEIKNYLKEVRI